MKFKVQFLMFCLWSITGSIASEDVLDKSDKNISVLKQMTALTIEETDIPVNFAMLNLDDSAESTALIQSAKPTRKYNIQKNLYFREFNSQEDAEAYSKNYNQQEKIIGGTDRREPLGKTIHEKPHNCHFYLEIFYNSVGGSSRTYYGSGTLVAYNLLLTAGHNLYDETDGGYPDRIDCFAACHCNDVLAEATIFPKEKPDSVFVSSNYVSSHGYDRSSDIALIIFDEMASENFKKTLSVAIPYTNLINFSYSQVPFYITGYPGQRVAYINTESRRGNVTPGSKANTVHYDIDTQKGQSGSGIWFKNKRDQKVYCIGVHTYGGDDKEDFNIGTLLTADIIEVIKKVKKHD